MEREWSASWLHCASRWKLSPEALAWAWIIERAVAERDFPIFPSPAGWKQFLELEYRQRAWAATTEGQEFYRACSEVEALVQRECLQDLAAAAHQAPAEQLTKVRANRHRLLTVPNPGYKARLIGTDPPQIVYFALRIMSPDPLRAIGRFVLDAGTALICIQEAVRQVLDDSYKSSVLDLHLKEGLASDQTRAYETVRAHLLHVADRVPGADVVAEDVVLDYVFRQELSAENVGDIHSFVERVAAGKAASHGGFYRKLLSALEKWRWHYESLEDHPEALRKASASGGAAEDLILDKMAFLELGRQLRDAEQSLDRIAGSGAGAIVRAAWERPEALQEELAAELGTNETKVKRVRARLLTRRKALNRRFDLPG